MERPKDQRPPAYLTPSPPLPEPATGVTKSPAGEKAGPDPTRYGDWEKKGVAIDF